MTTNKTERSVEIITNQHLRGSGIEVYADGEGAHGTVIANISHKINNVVMFGFAIKLYFRSEFINNEDGSPNILLGGEYGSLQVLGANTWLAGADRTDDVDYELGDDDRNIIIPALKAAIFKRLAETGTRTTLSIHHPQKAMRVWLWIYRLHSRLAMPPCILIGANQAIISMQRTARSFAIILK